MGSLFFAMDKLIILFSVLLVGMEIGRLNFFSFRFKLILNRVLIEFFVPVLTLNYLPVQEFEWEYIWLIITPWLVYLFSFLFFEGYNKLKSLEKETRAVLIMTSGIGSISFAGFPIFQIFYGEEGLTYGILLSLAGTFVVCNTVGSFTGFWYSAQEIRLIPMIRRILTFPPFLAMLVSFALMSFSYEHPPIIDSILDILSAPFSVLALFTIGINFRIGSLKENTKPFLLGQLYKLLIAPLFIYVVLYVFGAHTSLIGKVCILGAGIGSMNTIAIIAAQLDLNSRLAFLMPALGIPISILTATFIHFLISI